MTENTSSTAEFPTAPEPAATVVEPATGPFARRRTSRATAALVVGALAIGALAGVGGAATYAALDDSTASAAAGPLQATNGSNTVSLPANWAEKVAAKVLPSVVKVNVSGQGGSGSGSGVILRPDGTILTNNHVVALAANGGTLSVTLNDGRTVPARIVGTDPVTDLAIIKAQGVSGLTPATLGKSSQLQVGEPVAAFGAPYGLNSTVTTGIVSALNRPVSVATPNSQTPQQQSPFGQLPQSQSQQQADPTTTYPAIQTDAAINPGNSGGPLVDSNGNVVGINSSIHTATNGGDGSVGLGFAIPMDEALPIINQILDGQKPTHARLAVGVSDSATGATGALVKSVEGGGAAEAAGLKAGDLITAINGQPVSDAETLISDIRGHRPGDKVTLTYQRDGQTRTATATLGSDAHSNAS
ncbi:S1C family serine protease [Nocardioides baekrokdamisoli]|nr:trypsin-like peptidase domain-containing protein [Nocardioides baekrokdamisoli]